MKTWATGVDASGMTRQITVGDIWESMQDDRIQVEILSFNGQYFDVESHDLRTGYKCKAKVANFNEFVNHWQIVTYGVPPSPIPLANVPLGIGNLGIPIVSSIAYDYDGLPPMVEHIYKDEKIKNWGDFAKRCRCGAHSVGVKDYTKGHSSWCDVYSDT